MHKFALLSLLTLVAILGISISSMQLSDAQQNTTLTTNTSTNFTNLFSENNEFQNCIAISGMSPTCIPAIDVLYEDPSTIVLQSQYIDIIWKAVAEVKKDGYIIDDITSFSLSGYSPGSGQTLNMLVVMSK